MRRSSTVLFVFALAAATLASPLVGAVDPVNPPFGVSASPEAREVFPGQNATYEVRVQNDALFDREARMSVVSQLPADWTYSFSSDPEPLAIPAKSNATTTLTVYVPIDAKPQTLDITYEANESFSGFTRGNVSLTVKSAPTPGTQTLGSPRLTLTPSTGDAGSSGSLVEGRITLENVDPARPAMTATLSLSSAGGWRAYLPASGTTRVLDHGVPVSVPLYAEVPDLEEDASQEFTILVTVDGTTFVAHWTVQGLAPAETTGTTKPEGATSAANGTSATGGTKAPRGPLVPTGPNLEVLVSPVEISIPTNGEYTATVRLANTGNTVLEVALTGTPPPTWRPLEFETRSLSLAPGETADVPLTIYAPDVPPGGRASGSVSASGGGLVRGADFVISVIPGAPRDETSAALIEAPATPDGGLPGVSTTALVVVGLAAVGSAAAVVANRPLREKLLWGAAGLYTRLARPDVLGHEDREKLYRLVESQPGIHFHALQRDLAWNTGTLTYHLRVLEKHGFMVSRRDGLYRRFYLSGAAPRKEVFENQGPTGLRADVVEAIRNQPGISQSDLALGLGANKQTVNYHVKALERAGTIRVEKRGRDTFLYPVDATMNAGPGVARV